MLCDGNKEGLVPLASWWPRVFMCFACCGFQWVIFLVEAGLLVGSNRHESWVSCLVPSKNMELAGYF
ncbi:hypothetical protein BRADI_4g15183v3 [Brachypodium distachyon]|uniref:Uncharacterized protein n=1 Tax=Brachypodium distachyon TaxID=15368 RepID=A0A2K2CN04_BRADI|nr:hypothetical protein BRADI_4g15183v3 [Brachypodium distachyon]